MWICPACGRAGRPIVELDELGFEIEVLYCRCGTRTPVTEIRSAG